ncbi:2-hydroxychromene-2-carboxylate isomerase [Sphingorhabdus arenilitoris]|uniref:2-hydroxychromene-2-carboxylate isomerase n=1 Tax=Sphingorhabdus arenilitoris TaxID=1490041 RepID=A0ABV8RBU5_9SPHN
MKQIDFIFDFGSPNAYLAHHVLTDIAARTGARVNPIPCLLGGIFKATGNQAPMLAFAGIKGKMAYEMLEMRRFIARHGLTRFKMNAHFPVNTLLLMRSAVAAEQAGFLPAYMAAGFQAMWEDDRKMDEPEIFAEVMDKAGLDAAALLTAVQDETVKAQLAANTAAAVERGCFGVPTFYVGDEMFFGKERLVQVEQLLRS